MTTFPQPETPYLSKIILYPIKSLDGVEVSSVKITAGGSLERDREFALVDTQGRWVNAKRTAKIHQVRSQFDLAQRRVTLSSPTHPPETFSLDLQHSELEAWFSDFFEDRITLQRNDYTGFPDDLKASGPTIISEATLETTARWFDLSVAEMRSRLRTNLEVSGVPTFWEDRLFTIPWNQTGFQVGTVTLVGSNPCQRCIVPSRHPQTGAGLPDFQKRFIELRRASLLSWTNPDWFNHYYRLAVNTIVAESETGKVLSVGAVL